MQCCRAISWSRNHKNRPGFGRVNYFVLVPGKTIVSGTTDLALLRLGRPTRTVGLLFLKALRDLPIASAAAVMQAALEWIDSRPVARPLALSQALALSHCVPSVSSATLGFLSKEAAPFSVLFLNPSFVDETF